MNDYSTCTFCGEPTIGKDWVAIFKKKPICCTCYESMPLALEIFGYFALEALSNIQKGTTTKKPKFYSI